MIMKTNMKVRMELELEALAGHLNASDREVLARKFYRWAKQLYVSAHILRRPSEPTPSACSRPVRRRVRRISRPWPGARAESPDTAPFWPGPAD